MKISVVIPTVNRALDFKKALNSILAQTLTPHQVIIIDQSTNQQTLLLCNEIKSKFSAKAINLLYIFQQEKNTAKARNRGCSLATGNIISFFDDDIVLFDDYLENIVRHFNSNKLIAGLSGNVIIENKLRGWKWKLRKILLRLFLLNSFDGKMTISGFGFPIFEREIDQSMEVEMLLGCNMSYRKEFFENERFDEWFSGYCYREDVEMSYRISRKGILKMIPEAKLYHRYSRFNRADLNTQKITEIKNYNYFYRKHARRNIFSDFLFLYSLFGLFVILVIEYLNNFNSKKYAQLNGFLKGIVNPIRRKPAANK